MISIFSKISELKVGLLLDISNQIRYEVPSGQFTGFTLNTKQLDSWISAPDAYVVYLFTLMTWLQVITTTTMTTRPVTVRAPAAASSASDSSTPLQQYVNKLKLVKTLLGLRL